MPETKRTAIATHQPLFTGDQADRLAATAAAIKALSEGKSWALAQILVDIGLHGPASISDLARRIGLPFPTVTCAVRVGSTGRYRRSPDPARPGKVLRPALPGLLSVRKGEVCNTRIVALGPAGKNLLNALQGRWQDED